MFPLTSTVRLSFQPSLFPQERVSLYTIFRERTEQPRRWSLRKISLKIPKRVIICHNWKKKKHYKDQKDKMTNNGWENTTNEIKDRAVPPLEPGQFICELQASYSRTSLCQYWREQLLDFDLGNYSTFQDNIILAISTTPRRWYMLLDIFGFYPFYYSKANICCPSTLVVGGDKKVRLPLFICYICSFSMVVQLA